MTHCALLSLFGCQSQQFIAFFNIASHTISINVQKSEFVFCFWMTKLRRSDQ